ncbi:uncharacterized protein SAPINGB_P002149 [Magnusiomyces paraingens]|uniref:Uncharacterized protein n=1 Tax=Magnusiomyces paraingens TaxID=2606893 RepID=A0A5E8BD06_9ASCO|nr:uncharacterized protein SAPINGB_P002149 [Saprochaete ingens]VVT49193.1 unnamed protein product [Saprochaete ingens]
MSNTVITKAQLAHLDRAERYLYINAIAKFYQLNGFHPPLRLKDDDTVLGQIYFNSLSRSQYLSTNVFLGKYDAKKIAASAQRCPWQSTISLDECLLSNYSEENSSDGSKSQQKVPLSINEIHRIQQIEFEKTFQWITQKEREYSLEKERLAKQILLEQFFINNSNSNNNNANNDMIKIKDSDPTTIYWMMNSTPQNTFIPMTSVPSKMIFFSTKQQQQQQPCPVPGCTACATGVEANTWNSYYNSFQRYPENNILTSNFNNSSSSAVSVVDASTVSTVTTVTAPSTTSTFTENLDTVRASLGTVSGLGHGADVSGTNIHDVAGGVNPLMVNCTDSSSSSSSNNNYMYNNNNTTENLNFAVPVTATVSTPQISQLAHQENVSATAVTVRATGTNKKMMDVGAAIVAPGAERKRRAQVSNKGKISRKRSSKAILVEAIEPSQKKKKKEEEEKEDVKTNQIQRLQNKVIPGSYAKKSEELIVVNTTMINLPVSVYGYEDDEDDEDEENEEVYDGGNDDEVIMAREREQIVVIDENNGCEYKGIHLSGNKWNCPDEKGELNEISKHCQKIEMEVEQEIMKFDNLAFFPKETGSNEEEGPWGVGIKPYEFERCLFECQVS